MQKATKRISQTTPSCMGCSELFSTFYYFPSRHSVTAEVSVITYNYFQTNYRHNYSPHFSTGLNGFDLITLHGSLHVHLTSSIRYLSVGY